MSSTGGRFTEHAVYTHVFNMRYFTDSNENCGLMFSFLPIVRPIYVRISLDNLISSMYAKVCLLVSHVGYIKAIPGKYTTGLHVQ